MKTRTMVMAMFVAGLSVCPPGALSGTDRDVAKQRINGISSPATSLELAKQRINIADGKV